jgi:hypothetical protein
MDVRFSVADLIPNLAATYESMDLRTAAFRENNVWRNGITIVRLSYEEPSVAKERLLRLHALHGCVENDRFRIVMEARPFSQWHGLCRQVASGKIDIGNYEVALHEQIILEEQKDYLHLDYGHIRPFDGCQWPAVHLCLGSYDSSNFAGESIIRELAAFGYSHPYEAINALCEINVHHGSAPGCRFYLSIPVFARVSEVRILRQETCLELTISRHCKLFDVSGVVVTREGDFRVGATAKTRVPFGELVSSEERPIETVSCSMNLTDLKTTDWVEVKLTHPLIGEVEQFSRHARTLCQPTARNILYGALGSFCTDIDLRRLVVEPFAEKPKKLKPSAAFELHVGWLLGMFGFSVIVLGEYEKIVEPATKVERASVDILALDQKANILLLVACTLGTPKEEDFSNLLNARGILEREVFSDSKVEIIPTLFTCAIGSSTYKEVPGTLACIPIVDADGLDALLVILKTGQEERFLEFLSNPRLCRL